MLQFITYSIINCSLDHEFTSNYNICIYYGDSHNCANEEPRTDR